MSLWPLKSIVAMFDRVNHGLMLDIVVGDNIGEIANNYGLSTGILWSIYICPLRVFTVVYLFHSHQHSDRKQRS